MSLSKASRKTGPREQYECGPSLGGMAAFDQESDMAKGQVKKNKEARKPKATKAVGAKTSSVTDVFAKATSDATHSGKKKPAA